MSGTVVIRSLDVFIGVDTALSLVVHRGHLDPLDCH